MKLFVAGPMTGYPEHNIPAFEQAARWLRWSGHDVTTPVEVNALHELPAPTDQKVGDPTYETYLERDLALIAGPDIEAIVCLPGWQASNGACIEVELAVELGKPVYQLGGVPPVNAP